MLNDYSNDEIDIVEDVVQPVEPISATSSGGPMDSAWPMKCHDNRHTGRSPYSTVNTNNLEKWRFKTSWQIEGGVIIGTNGTIYFGSFDKYLYALNLDGSLKWRFKTGHWIWSSPAIAEDGTIYVGSWNGKLYAINSNGTKKWSSNAGATIACSPAIAEDGTIYVGTMNSGNSLVAFYPNGTLKWKYETGYSIVSCPAIGDDDTVYVGSGDEYFYAINPNGTLKWRFKTGDVIKGPPSIADDGTVYIGSFDDYLYAFYPNNGTMKWKLEGMGTNTNPSIADDGTIYNGNEYFYAINPNGTLKWSFDMGTKRSIHQSSPAISADGTIYVGTGIDSTKGGEIIAVNPDGTEKWRSNIIANNWISSSPAIGEDGTVYIGSSSDDGGVSYGYLHAFGPVESNSPPETPTISGEANGIVREDYEYKLRVVDPDNNPISFYIDWGDGFKEWTPERASGEKIRCKAKDTLGEESNWAYLEVTMPKNQNMWFLRWMERFPLVHRLFNALKGNLGS